MKPSRRWSISVIGSSSASPEILSMAEELGRQIMEAGFNLISGGLNGIMDAVSKGAFSVVGEKSGRIVGILPTDKKEDASPYVDIVIPTGIGFARNYIVALSGDALVVVNGGSGTLTEIAYAWRFGKPIVALTSSGGWARKLAGERLDDRHAQAIYAAGTPSEAVKLLKSLLD